MNPVCSVLVGVSDGDGWSVSPVCSVLARVSDGCACDWMCWSGTGGECDARHNLSQTAAHAGWLLESELSELEHVELECTLDDHEIEGLRHCRLGNRVGVVSGCGLQP